MISAIGRSAIGNVLWGYPTSFHPSRCTLFFGPRNKSHDVVEQNLTRVRSTQDQFITSADIDMIKWLVIINKNKTCNVRIT
jgi:hypothetical protein